MVRPWGMPGGRGSCCGFSMARYLGTILRFPQSRCAEPSSVPGASASRAGAGTVCRSHFRAGFWVGCCVFGRSPRTGGASDEKEKPGAGWTALPQVATQENWTWPGAALPGRAECLAPRPSQPDGVGSSLEHWDEHFLCLPL